MASYLCRKVCACAPKPIGHIDPTCDGEICSLPYRSFSEFQVAAFVRKHRAPISQGCSIKLGAEICSADRKGRLVFELQFRRWKMHLQNSGVFIIAQDYVESM